MTAVHNGRFLVRGNGDNRAVSELLVSNVPLSFWGGIDPETGQVIDATHPLHGELVTDTILCIPSGRGSCTASQVLLELILANRAPRAIVLRDVDGLVCVGALVAQEVFASTNVPDILCLGTTSFNALLRQESRYGFIKQAGDFVVASNIPDVEHTLDDASPQESAPSSSLVDSMLSNEEQHMLETAANEAERMALRVLVRYATLTSSSPGTTQYLDIVKAHIDGCTYIGPGGLAYVKRLQEQGGQVKVPTTLNSVSADRRRWQALGVPQDRALASIAVGDAYLALGCEHSFTCAPYLLTDPPQLGQDICWGESNAVVYANSVLGARTEKYADYLDICCALVGKVPADGVHLEEKRKPRIVLDATAVLHQLWNESSEQSHKDLELLFPVLGHLCGSLSDGYVPIVLGFHDEEWSKFVTKDHLKSFCAAYGTTGTTPLIHIAGVTPEARSPSVVTTLVDACDQPTRIVTLFDLEKTFYALDSSRSDRPETVDLVALGNPHLSLSECETLDKLVAADNKRSITRIMACMSRAIYSEAKTIGYVETLERFGVEFVNDTCWCMLLDGPVIPSNPDSVIMSNSGKYCHYGPGLTGRDFRFGSLADCIEAAATGLYPRRLRSDTTYPTWLSSKASSAQANQRRSYSRSQSGSQAIAQRRGQRWVSTANTRMCMLRMLK